MDESEEEPEEELELPVGTRSVNASFDYEVGDKKNQNPKDAIFLPSRTTIQIYFSEMHFCFFMHRYEEKNIQCY